MTKDSDVDGIIWDQFPVANTIIDSTAPQEHYLLARGDAAKQHGYMDSYNAWSQFPATDERPADPYPAYPVDPLKTVNTQPFWKQQLLHGPMPGTKYQEETYSHSNGPLEWLDEMGAKTFGSTPYPEIHDSVDPRSDAQGVLQYMRSDSSLIEMPGTADMDMLDPSLGYPMGHEIPVPHGDGYARPELYKRTPQDEIPDPTEAMNWNSFPEIG